MIPYYAFYEITSFGKDLRRHKCLCHLPNMMSLGLEMYTP